MKKTTRKMEMLPEYDFSKGVRGKYAKQYKQGTNIVILEKDVAALAIRGTRKKMGLTQAQLAKEIGTTQSVIARLENADYRGHTLKLLEHRSYAYAH